MGIQRQAPLGGGGFVALLEMEIAIVALRFTREYWHTILDWAGTGYFESERERERQTLLL
jgi:hypothetical protein